MTKEVAIKTVIRGVENAPIKALEKFMLALPQEEAQLDHFFSDGLYARKMTMNAAELVVGHTHNQSHLAILLKGQVAVHSRNGTAVFNAPYITNVLAGDKRAFFAVTEVQWMTIHATLETDIDVLEQTLAGE